VGPVLLRAPSRKGRIDRTMNPKLQLYPCPYDHTAKCSMTDRCLGCKDFKPVEEEICPTESGVTCHRCGAHYWWTSTSSGSKRHCGCCTLPLPESRCLLYTGCTKVKSSGCYAKGCYNDRAYEDTLKMYRIRSTSGV
jgi:hypothetical protein